MSLSDRRQEELNYQLAALRDPTDMQGRKWHLTPIMEALYKDNIATDDKYRALKYNVNATDKIAKTIKYCVEHDEYTVIEIVGATSSGKSQFALRTATDLRVEWYRQLKEDCRKGLREDYYMPRVHIGSSVEETQSFFKKARKGDVIIQDEDPDASGSGANTLLKNIKNILSICRESCINFIFVSPDMASYLETLVTFRVETMSKDYKRRITKAALYTPKNLALGYVYVEILPKDDKLVIRYLKVKRANIQKIKDAGGGFSSTFKEKDILKYAEKIADYFVDRYGIEDAVNLSIGRIKDMCRWSIIGKPQRDQEAVAYYVAEVLKERYSIYEVEDVEEDEDGELKAVLIDTKDDVELLEIILAHSKGKTESEKLGIAWFEEYYINGLNQEPATDKINEDFNTNYDRTSFLNTHFPAFQRTIIGKAAEKAIHEAYYSESKIDGGQGKPDLVHDDWIGEIKARTSKDKRRPLKLIEEEVYLKEYIKRGDPVRLITISYGKQSCIVKVYDISYSKGVDDIDDVN